MEIVKFGAGSRIDICKRTLANRTSDSSGRLVLLPIPTSRDGVFVTGTDTELMRVITLCREGDLLAGYAIPDWAAAELSDAGVQIYDAALDEGFLLENAKITAHGVLGRILTETGRDIGELSVGIIGYGRIGGTLSELLLFLGAEVRIYSTDPGKVTELSKSGADASLISSGAELSGVDILINTAPKKLVDEAAVLRLLDSGAKIIELASGNNFASDGIVSMMSVPDKMYPKSAGMLYASAIMRAFKL